MTSTIFSSIRLNEPLSSVYEPSSSVLPERLRSITTPIGYPIVGEDFSSSTEPVIVDEFEEIVSE